ncbi:MAG: vWA domain-containing protein [Lentisphaerota bacterium]
MLYFSPIIPIWLILVIILIAALAIALSLHSGTGHVLTLKKKRLLVALRASAFFILILMLLSPVLNKLEVNRQKSNIVFLIDSSTSMGVKDVGGDKTRYQAALAFMKEKKFGKLAGYPISFYTFGDKAEKKVGVNELDKVRVSGGTNFADAVKQVDKDIGLSETAALVLITDGIDYSGFKGTDIQVPVFSVRTGSELNESKDVGIDYFKYPEKVRIGEEIELKVPVSLHGYDKIRGLDLNISEDGISKEQRKLKVERGSMIETVKYGFKTEGVHILKLQVNRLPGEVSYLNNEREIAFEVLKDDSAIVVYFPELSNSFRPMIRFLEQKLEKFTSFYKVADGKYVIRGIEPDQKFSGGIPDSPEKLSSVSTFILGSHNRPGLTDGEENVLEKYVSGGGSLILLGGNDSFGILPDTSPLRRLSPFVHADNSFATGNYKVAVNDEELNNFTERIQEIIRRNADDPDFTLKSVNAVKQVKNNSKVLLWADSMNSRQPLVAIQPFGKGIVIGVLSNSFYLWGGTACRTDNFNDFWQQLLNYAKAGNDSDILKISVNKSEMVPGDNLEVNAIVNVPDAGNAGQVLRINAELSDLATNKIAATFTMERKGEFYKCSFPALKPGRYLLKVTCMDKDRILRQRFKLILSGDTIKENLNIKSEANRFLDYSSGKHIYKTDERNNMEKDIYESISKNKIEREKKLVFKTPWFFAILLTLLLTEWTLRRKFNVI